MFYKVLISKFTTVCIWYVAELITKLNRYKMEKERGINIIREEYKKQCDIHVVVSTSNCEHVRGGLILRNKEWFIECRKCGDLY